jgi:hypothetical protein
MADVLAVARRQYVARQLLARRAVLATRKAWRQLDPSAIRPTWAAIVGPAVLAIVTGAQLEAASVADSNANAALVAQGITAPPVALVSAAAFAGVASDGRDLAGLLELSNLYALRQVRLGQSVNQALAVGGRWLETAVGTQVVDAGRVAAGVATATRTAVSGYYRVLNLPSCSRCIVLAGIWYQWNAGFERHPHCDCSQIPGDRDSPPDELKTPQQVFDSLPMVEQNRVFTAAGAESIRNGADLNQVVNARRGMYSAGGRKLTTANARKFGGARLMPEQIWREAHGNRDEAIRLLQRFGYIR